MCIIWKAFYYLALQFVGRTNFWHFDLPALYTLHIKLELKKIIYWCVRGEAFETYKVSWSESGHELHSLRLP